MPVARLRRRLLAQLRQRYSGSEPGIALVIVALAATVLIGAVALGVDGARLYDERRRAQNAADHAASTSAHSLCRLGRTVDEAIADGEGSAALNGYNDNGTTNTVDLAFQGGSRFVAAVSTNIPATFSGVLGWSRLSTGASATAECTGSGGAGPGAIYAGGDSCVKNTNGKYQIDVSGSNQRVYGGVHANADVNIGSSPNWWTDGADPEDPFTYVGTLYGGGGNTFEAGYPQDVGPAQPDPIWPEGYEPSDATALLDGLRDAAQANGTYFASKVTTITGDGVYYTTSSDGMDISSVSGSSRNVTLVAPNGPIKLSASSKTFNPAPDLPEGAEYLLMLSTKAYSASELCDKYTIAVSGSTSTWNGIMWAPGGLLEVSGSSNSAVNGTLLGWAVRLNGSDISITYNSDFFTKIPDVLLVE